MSPQQQDGLPLRAAANKLGTGFAALFGRTVRCREKRDSSFLPEQHPCALRRVVQHGLLGVGQAELVRVAESRAHAVLHCMKTNL